MELTGWDWLTVSDGRESEINIAFRLTSEIHPYGRKFQEVVVTIETVNHWWLYLGCNLCRADTSNSVAIDVNETWCVRKGKFQNKHARRSSL